MNISDEIKYLMYMIAGVIGVSLFLLGLFFLLAIWVELGSTL